MVPPSRSTSMSVTSTMCRLPVRASAVHGGMYAPAYRSDNRRKAAARFEFCDMDIRNAMLAGP